MFLASCNIYPPFFHFKFRIQYLVSILQKSLLYFYIQYFASCNRKLCDTLIDFNCKYHFHKKVTVLKNNTAFPADKRIVKFRKYVCLYRMTERNKRIDVPFHSYQLFMFQFLTYRWRNSEKVPRSLCSLFETKYYSMNKKQSTFSIFSL